MAQGYVRAKNTMHVSQFLMLKGNDASGLVDLWAADDPVVLQHPDWFTDDFESVARRSAPKPMETAAHSGKGRGRMETATNEPSVA